MTREEALFEICELAQSVLIRTTSKDGPSELFNFAESIKGEVADIVSGSPCSKEYKSAEQQFRDKWHMYLGSESEESIKTV